MAYGKFVKTPGMLPGTPFAMDFTTIGSSIWAAANKNINQQLETVQGNYVKFLTESEKMQVELDRAKELLRTENSLDPMLFIHGTTDLILGEGANEFIDIRIHQSNLGVKTLDSAHVYHDLMLTLPTINDTIQ